MNFHKWFEDQSFFSITCHMTSQVESCHVMSCFRMRRERFAEFGAPHLEASRCQTVLSLGIC